MRRLSGPGLVVYGITITFAAVDWIMSLQPAFHSTIFGPLVASNGLISAHAFTLLVLLWLSRRPPVAEFVSPDVIRDLGNLLLTFLILWAYMVFFQFMLIWIADLRYEVIWYLPRVARRLGMGGLGAVPLRFRRAVLRPADARGQGDSAALAKVAGLLLFMQLVFAYYQVVPAFPHGTTSSGTGWIF